MTADTALGFKHNITPELENLARDITEAMPYPRNPRKHRLDKIAASLVNFGQRSPIIVQASTGYIVKGNGTWRAARNLGWTAIAQLWQEMDDDTAKAYLLADNKASDDSEYDLKELTGLLDDLIAGPKAQMNLFDPEEIADLKEQVAGFETLEATGQPMGEFLNSDKNAERSAELQAKAKNPLKEMNVLLSREDYTEFMANAKVLQAAFGEASIQRIIVEAVRRCAAAEEGRIATGQSATDGLRQGIIVEFVQELQGVVQSMPSVTAGSIGHLLSQYLPVVAPPEPEVAGQTAAFTEAEAGAPDLTADAARVFGENEPTDDVDGAETLERSTDEAWQEAMARDEGVAG